MNTQRLWSIARIFAALTMAAGSAAMAQAPTPEHFSGIISDYTPLNPNSGTNPTGPYEMHGRWSLHLKRDGKADFSAFMAMELSDYWVWHSNADPTDPTIRGAHTHHIVLSDVAVTLAPPNSSFCPADIPGTTPRFLISGPPTIFTGNGNAASFVAKGASTLYVCVTGGSEVEYSNMTMVLTGTATGHFGTQAIHGAVRFPRSDDGDRHDDRR